MADPTTTPSTAPGVPAANLNIAAPSTSSSAMPASVSATSPVSTQPSTAAPATTAPTTSTLSPQDQINAISAQIPNLQKQIQDYLTSKSTNVTPPPVPSRNQDTAPTPTAPSPTPTAPAPPQSLTDLFKSIRDTLTPATAAPTAPNLVATRGTLAAQPGGVNDAQTALASAKTDLQNFEAGLANEQNRLKGQAIASTIINGQLVKLDADMAQAYRAKQNAVTQATDRLNQANSTLASIMDLTEKDYTNASQEYNDNFTKNLNLFNAASSAYQFQQSEADKEKTQQQNMASANLKTILDSLASSGKQIDLSTITADQKASWNKMELAAGLPQGFMEAAIQANSQGVKVDHWQTDSNTGITYAFGTKNGQPVLLKTFQTGTGSSSDKVQQKLESDYKTTLLKEMSNRSGGLGLQDQKVNQAIHLKALVNQYYDPQTGNYNIPTAQYAELVLGLANLISGTGSTDAGDRQALMSKTAAGDLKGALQYITGTPQNGNTQEIIKNLVDSIDRQGQVAQQLRDQDVAVLHGLAPTDLDPSRRAALEKNLLPSYTNSNSSSSVDLSGLNFKL